MDEFSLTSVLDEPQAVTQPEPTDPPQAEPQAEPEVQQPEPTGEEQQQVETPPVETPEEKMRKGQQAALLAERRRRQELEERLRQYEQQKPQEAQQLPGEPQREQFASDRDYYLAIGEYAAQQRIREWSEQQQQEQQTRQERERIQKLQTVADERVAAGQAKYKDFDAVVNNGLAPFLTPVMHQEILTYDNSEDIAYHLGQNPHEAARIAELPERDMVRELTRLESRLKAQPVPQQEQPKPSIPQTLTQSRDAKGRFEPPQAGPTPLDSVLGR